MGVIGSAKLLQALARDNIVPGLSSFSQGTKESHEPIRAIAVTYLVAQLTLLCNINQIASFITMTYLLTFFFTNLACFLLKVSAAPNFRPSFHYFNWQTAAAGALVSGVAMFFVDRLYATGSVGMLIALFLLIHYTSPPKSWGDVSQSLIYHQVRKYLLRLRQGHVKYWRPQILLLVNDPSKQYDLVQFCNSMKKGALYVLGHVIVSEDFEDAAPEVRRQQAAWTRYIDVTKVKAFLNVTVAPSLEWGVRNIVMSTGLGGMRPNIVVMGFYNHEKLKQLEAMHDLATSPLPGTATDDKRYSKSATPEITNAALGSGAKGRLLPTDTCRVEEGISAKSYVTLLEDLLMRLRINVALARGFEYLTLPTDGVTTTRQFIDLWPIQMSAEIVSEGDDNPNVLTTNFDTYTLILQLGCILNTVSTWKKTHALRIAVFVEFESDVEEERERVRSLLEVLRIEAQVLVFCLASGHLKTYEIIVNGQGAARDSQANSAVQDALGNDRWWQELQDLRTGSTSTSNQVTSNSNPGADSLLSAVGPALLTKESAETMTELVSRKRRHTMSGINTLGINLGMRTHRLLPDLIEEHVYRFSPSESSDSSDDEDVIVSESDSDVQHPEEGHTTPAMKFPVSSPAVFQLKDKPVSRTPPPPPSTSTAPALEHSRGAFLFNQADRTDGHPVPAHAPASPSHERALEPPAPGDFTSQPMPPLQLASDSDNDDPSGPSITFAATTPLLSASIPNPDDDEGNNPDGRPRLRPRRSIYARDSYSSPSSSASNATGYPVSQSLALSFNDLPCRAQHLILNELIRQQSHHTAVLFTTLPSPTKGTCKSELDSLRYLSDLEVLCDGLPPMLLVHSNSMTVTTNL
ncbi:MAG: hypothetical protein M1826_006622 [Phylliscum demangeonii]|nr:MAG: hypothetical protein M1826_006622 [Phylliscum demangeonii]